MQMMSFNNKHNKVDEKIIDKYVYDIIKNKNIVEFEHIINEQAKITDTNLAITIIMICYFEMSIIQLSNDNN